MKVRFLMLGVLGVVCAPGAGAVVVISDWDDPSLGRDGWIRNHTNDGFTGSPQGDSSSTVTRQEISGNGYLRSTDAASGNVDYFVAPSKFEGDYTQFLTATISFDYARISPATISSNDGIQLILRNGTRSATHTFTPSGDFNTTVNTFFTQSVNVLDASQFTLSGGATSLEDVLQNVDMILLDGEVRTGTESNGVDNFTLEYTTAVPEPATLVALGLGTLFLRRRRAR